jgi:hypothetical protein
VLSQMVSPGAQPLVQEATHCAVGLLPLQTVPLGQAAEDQSKQPLAWVTQVCRAPVPDWHWVSPGLQGLRQQRLFWHTPLPGQATPPLQS